MMRALTAGLIFQGQDGIQPRSGPLPIALDAYWRDSEDFCGFLYAQSAKVPQFHDTGLAGIDLSE